MQQYLASGKKTARLLASNLLMIVSNQAVLFASQPGQEFEP
jgi:hypothetical protein